MDNSLRVNPDVLIDGAQRFHDTHQELIAVLAKVHSGQEGLHGKWTGAAATRGNTMWSDVHEAFSAHIEHLAEHAENLHTAAGQYRDTDTRSGADINQQM